MAIATTILRKDRVRGATRIFGKSVISGDTATGDVETGLYRVRDFSGTVAAAAASAVSANEAFPLGKGAVTVYTGNNNETFYWEAIGDPV